jgi:serine/threonine-protein kinase RsbT
MTMSGSQEFRVRILGESDVAVAVMQAQRYSRSVGFNEAGCCRIATAVSELARNILKYADSGEIVFRPQINPRHMGIEISALDNGPGIADLELALTDRYSTGKTLGLGLPGVRRLMDDFDVQTAPGQGTRVTIRKWL